MEHEMTEWEIRPFTSVGPVPFGIDTEEAARIIGPPELERLKKGYNNYNDFVRLFFKPDFVEEVSVAGNTPLDIMLFGINIFKDDKMSVLQELEKKNDGPVYDAFGFLVFKKFGMLLTGIHDDDEAQRAVSLRSYDGFTRSYESYETKGYLSPITFL